MPSPTFVLKQPKGTEHTLIFLVFRFQGARLKYSTQEKVIPKDWNPVKQRVRETRGKREDLELNARLMNIERTVLFVYRRLINDNIRPTPTVLKLKLDTELNRIVNNPSGTFIDFCEHFIKTSTKRPNTLRNYKQALRALISFSKSYHLSLRFDDIDLNFYDHFLKFAVKRNYAKNTIGSFIKNIKVFMNAAFDRKLTFNYQFRHKSFKTLDEDVENVYLNKEELEQIELLEIKGNPKLTRVRDLFLNGCYTGLRFSDLAKLKPENIANNRIKVNTTKTGDSVVIPIHPTIKKILGRNDNKIPWAYSNQKMNDYLKDIAKLAKLDETILLSTTKGGVKEDESFKKHDLITVHTARRSFATNAFKSHIPAISIMKITGHKTEKAFLKYIKISKEENAELLDDHPFFQ